MRLLVGSPAIDALELLVSRAVLGRHRRARRQQAMGRARMHPGCVAPFAHPAAEAVF